MVALHRALVEEVGEIDGEFGGHYMKNRKRISPENGWIFIEGKSRICCA
jgi:hypothetical protein